MKCTNTSCGKTFETPLQIYNGTWLCPHCLAEQVTISSYKVTKENEELFRFSELYFLRYIAPNSYNAPLTGIFKDDPTELLKQAIENCEASAKTGNPKALYKMGFYNEYYLGDVKSSTEKVRSAFDYYLATAFNEQPLSVETGAKNISPDELASLKKQAAASILRLCSKFPEEVNSLKGNEKYNAMKNQERILRLYPELGQMESLESNNANKVRTIFKILNNCFSKKRAPLFGTFMLSVSELKELFAIPIDPKKKIFNCYKIIDNGVQLRYLLCDAHGQYRLDDAYFNKFANQRDIEAKEFNPDSEEKLPDDGYVWLYFFNTKGKHNLLSKSQMNKVEEDLRKGEYHLLNRIISWANQEYLFYDDDIYQYLKKGNSIKNCVEKLKNQICGEE